MWTRVVVGLVLCLLGALWFAQGVGVAKGSPMTGHGLWSWIGGGMVIVGVALLILSYRSRDSRADD